MISLRPFQQNTDAGPVHVTATHLRGSLVALELLDVELLDKVCFYECSPNDQDARR